ncbi:Processing protease [Planktothrix serta PCC 8927]|uniref:Processing protease n=1 Tax=Planktothrix serta PCC 8927 TaxID=671068 RepID=A0A7Z9C3C8_9CYAN|nr:pitrilysin family protein [Planktothrix serta]VXD25007.1 Processing protease [Planktothrix serta PCC 8927]
MSQVLAASTFPASTFKLNNGLTVIHQQMTATPVVVVDVWVRAGAIYEPDMWSGMAHFLEHMIFKGTDWIGPGVFDQVIESCGGVANAATSHDYAHFYITTAVHYLEETLHALGDLLLHATIPDGEFNRERDVVLEEIRQATDDPDWLSFQALMETVYARHPYSRSVLGTEAKIRSHSPQEMRRFHQSRYQPENMVVVIVGGVEEQQALDLINQAFSRFLPPTTYTHLYQVVQPQIHGIHRRELHLPYLEEARLTLAWTGPGVEQLRQAYGLDLLSSVIASGRTSRLVQKLREKLQLVHDICSDFSLQQESSLFTISALLEYKDLEKVEALICEEIHELMIEPISEAELRRSQRFLCNDYAFSTETPGQLAGLYGYYFTVAKPELAVTYPEQIQSFQPLELQNIVKELLNLENYAVMVVQP